MQICLTLCDNGECAGFVDHLHDGIERVQHSLFFIKENSKELELKN